MTKTVTFCGLNLSCSDEVFEPMPQTEFLVETVSERIGHDDRKVLFDVFCGIGAVGSALAVRHPNLVVYGTDSSPKAIEIAKENSDAHDISHRVHWFQGSVLEPLRERKIVADIVVANPPYIPSFKAGEITSKPVEAVDGGFDGFKFYRLTATQAAQCLNPGGLLALEAGSSRQGEGLQQVLARTSFFEPATVIPVPGLNEVVVTARRLSGIKP